MENKRCFKCGTEKQYSDFYSHKQMGDGLLGKCKECTKKDVRENRKHRAVYYNKFDRERYRHSAIRIWNNKYSSMRRRITGKSAHSKLTGKDLLSRSEFINWCEENQEKFFKLYRAWSKSGYKRKNAPSIDRINNRIGYIVGNMQWITQRENSIKHAK